MAATPDQFQLGDRVRHIGMNEEGEVLSIDRDGTIHVQYDRTDDKGRHWIGVYDAAWFRIHPDLLVRLLLRAASAWKPDEHGNLSRSVGGDAERR